MNRRGTVLYLVLVVTALATMIAASLLFRMQAEVRASAGAADSEQAYAAALSGVHRAAAVLRSGTDTANWYDRPDVFAEQLVCDDGVNRWYYTIYAYNPSDPTTVRNGLADEAGKININLASEQTLLRLPNMTSELVACLLDFRDRDNDTRPEGAEQDYYSQLPQPYLVRNGPFGTIEELLLVKGFTGSIVYGEDANMNGLLDVNEDDQDASFPSDNGDGVLDLGLKGTATAISYEPNTDSTGRRRVNVNAANASRLRQAGLPQATSDFISLYRSEGNTFGHHSQLLEMRYTLQREATIDGRRYEAGAEIESGVGADELPAIMDKLCSSQSGRMVMGQVNVNTASAEVLAMLDGIDANLAQEIVDARGGLSSETQSTVAWLYTQGVVDAEKFVQIAPQLTARSRQFHLRCVGYGYPLGRFRVIEAVIDTAGQSPRISYLRDITRLGLPFPLIAPQEAR